MCCGPSSMGMAGGIGYSMSITGTFGCTDVVVVAFGLSTGSSGATERCGVR